jgi:hypothetical protein
MCSRFFVPLPKQNIGCFSLLAVKNLTKRSVEEVSIDPFPREEVGMNVPYHQHHAFELGLADFPEN